MSKASHRGRSPHSRGFPHDCLAGADYTLGGMSAKLEMPPGRSRHS